MSMRIVEPPPIEVATQLVLFTQAP